MKGLVPWKLGKRSMVPAHWEDWFGRLQEVPLKSFFLSLKSMLPFRTPSIDVTENKDEVRVRAGIPGLSEKDLELTWQDGILQIRGEKKEEKEENGKGNYYHECSYGSFSRSVPVGSNINLEKARAKYKHGVLTVTLPKTEQQGKSVTVNAE